MGGGLTLNRHSINVWIGSMDQFFVFFLSGGTCALKVKCEKKNIFVVHFQG